MALGLVNTPSLNLRDAPDGQIVTILTGGTTVETLAPDASGNWLFVSADVDGITFVGWVTARFIDTSDGDPATGPTGPVPSDPTGGIFDTNNWTKYGNVLGQRESGNNYRSVNQLGFCGRWQFGASALIDGGYVRLHTATGNLSSPGVWLGKDGVSSRDDWLNNQDAQNSAMLVYTKAHYNFLLGKHVLQPNSSLPRCAGLLAAAHLLGPGGAIAFVQGSVGHDANGTTSVQYYKLLSTAFGGSGVLEP
jgi:hypothetical protein